jgi:hypothetical protein
VMLGFRARAFAIRMAEIHDAFGCPRDILRQPEYRI